MITYYNPYFPGPITPVVNIGQNLGVYIQGAYNFFRVLFVEGLPPGRQTIQDFGAVNAATTGTTAEVTVINAQEGSLVHVRAAPLDDFEAQFSQQRATGRFATESQQIRVRAGIYHLDPYGATTTLFVLGNSRQVYCTPTNNTAYNLAQTRCQFWGFRYVLDRLTKDQEHILQFAVTNKEGALRQEERDALKFLHATIVPAEGREGS